MTKILITGGAGFIGSHIADKYLQQKHEVIILDDLSSGIKKNIPQQARFYQESILSPNACKIIETEKPDVINHHAAQIDVRKSVSDPVGDATINIQGGLNIFEAGRKSGVKKFIFASSGGAIYGDPKCIPTDENHRTDPLSPYGIAKLTIEKYLQFYSTTYKIPFVALRYGNVYGPRQNGLGEAGVVAIFIERIRKHQPLWIYGDGKQTRDYIYVEDIAQYNLAALSPETSGIFNIGTGIETDVLEIAKFLTKLSGHPIEIIHKEAKIGEQQRCCLKSSSIQKSAPVMFPDGLKKTFDWFQEQHRD